MGSLVQTTMELEDIRIEICNIRDRLVEKIGLATDRTLSEVAEMANSLGLNNSSGIHDRYNIQPNLHTADSSAGNMFDERTGQLTFNLSDVCRNVLSLERLGQVEHTLQECVKDDRRIDALTSNLKQECITDHRGTGELTDNSNRGCTTCEDPSVSTIRKCHCTEPWTIRGNAAQTDTTENRESITNACCNQTDTVMSSINSPREDLRDNFNSKERESRCTQTDGFNCSVFCSVCESWACCKCPQDNDVCRYNESRVRSRTFENLNTAQSFHHHKSEGAYLSLNDLSPNKRLGSNYESGVPSRSMTRPKYTPVIFDLERRRSLDERSWSSDNTLSAAASSISDNNHVSCFMDTVPILPPASREAKILNNTIYEDSVSSDVKQYDGFMSCHHRGPCVIPDIDILPDNRIVLTDHYHCNIQLYGNDLTLLSEVPCSYPMGLTCVNSYTVAVSLRRNKEVAIYFVGDSSLTLHKVITVPCDFYIWNVVFKARNLHVVCDENNIHVFDCDEENFKVIPSNIPTNKGYVRYFDVSDDGNLLYLCEPTGLHCITNNGIRLWTFTAERIPESERPKDGYIIEDVCYVNRRLLATQWTRSRIFEISLSGEFMRNLVVDGIQNPRAISVRNQTMVVTQFHPMMKTTVNRTVKVFKIGYSGQNISESE